jgi:hypothetical protein
MGFVEVLSRVEPDPDHSFRVVLPGTVMQRVAHVQFFDDVGSRGKWGHCAADDEADARRQTRPARSRANGQRKNSCGHGSIRKPDGRCFGRSNSSSISTEGSGECETAGQAQCGPKPKAYAEANTAPTEVALRVTNCGAVGRNSEAYCAAFRQSAKEEKEAEYAFAIPLYEF